MGKKTVRSPWLCFAAILALALVATACGDGGGSDTEEDRAPTLVPPAVTPTLSPMQDVQTLVQDIQTVCLDVQQSYPQIEEEFYQQPIAGDVQSILAGLGLRVVVVGIPCDATLTFALTGEALGESYMGAPRDRCYTGAEVSGQMTLTMPERAPLTLPISERKPPTSGIIFSCPYETNAPFESVWAKAVLNGLAHLWPRPHVIAQALVQPSVFWVGGAAALALEESGPQEAREVAAALVQALEDKEPLVRRAAVFALGEIGPEAKDAVPALVQGLEDEDEGVREATAEALQGITGQDFGRDADRWQQWWEEQE